jgi:uncharacterized protein YbjQ (UPF0145 family)
MTTPNSDPIRVMTADGPDGMRIVSTLGVVIGIAIRSRGVGGNIMAGLEALASANGSAMDEYRDDLLAIRREAIERMSREAKELGANAVIGMRFDAADVGREMVEIVAFGTAVLLDVSES